MKSVEPSKVSLAQLQDKVKRNFQGLCAKCPQLANNFDVLDDSLTSLHWLSNLNVNIASPTKDAGKDGNVPRSHNLLPSFPSALLKNGLPNQPPGSTGPNFFVPGEMTYAKRNWNVQAPKGSPMSATKARNGGSRRNSAKTGRNLSAHTLGRPSPPQTDTNQRLLHSASHAASKMIVRGLPITSQLTTPLPTSNEAQLFTAPGWMHDLPDAKIAQNGPRSATHSAHLPHLSVSSKLLPAGVDEPLTSEAATATSNYTFSPREAMLDLLPGQVDYKNNPYVKPTFSYTTLICMALQNNKKHKMSFSSICKWIADNFMFYRYADPGWQNSVKLNLTQSKYFAKVHKKDSSTKSYLWEINPNSNIKLRDANSPLLLSNFRRNDPRLEPVQISPANSLSLPSVPILPKFDNEDGANFSTRKRKQTTPQRAVRRRTGSAKKRRNNAKSSGNKNLLQEEAPELGSLKGDFNWNTIFDEFFGATEAALSVTPTSLASRPSTNEGNEGRNSQLADDVTSGTILALDMLTLPDLPEPETNDENHALSPLKVEPSEQTSWQPVSETSAQQPAAGKLKSAEKITALPHPQPPSLPKSNDLDMLEGCDLLFPDPAVDVDFLSLSEFLKGETDLDLTITGKQIEPPTEWIPVSPSPDSILCETQNDEVIYQHPSETLDVDSLFSMSSTSSTNNPDQYLSSGDRKRKQKLKRAGQMLNGNASTLPTRQPSLRKQNYFTSVHM